MSTPSLRIVHRRSSAVLWEGRAATIKDAINAALKSDADLYGADLSGADLSRANLSGADLYGADLSRANLSGADLSGANLSRANLSGADLSRANLSGADLSRANLSGADLSRANLSGADLSRANLSGADLYGADGISPERTTPLLMLLDQPGPIRAYKLVTADGVGPFNGGITYQVGQEYAVSNANCDPHAQCGAGINLATLAWCLGEWRPCYRVLVAEFAAADIAAIPTATDGKFRVHRCRIVAEKDISAYVALPKKVQA